MYKTGKYKAFLILLSLVWMLWSCEQKSASGNSGSVTITPSPAIEKSLPPGIDKSPMDMSYFPVDYPKLKMAKNVQGPLLARVIYSRPQKSGRIIFGDVLKYGNVWRLGANEATEIEFFKEVNINNQKIDKGRYVLYCIPYEDKWTLVLNNDLFTWGLKIDSTKDLYRFTVPISKTKYPFEVFSMEFEKTGKGAQLVMEWDSVQAKLPINFK